MIRNYRYGKDRTKPQSWFVQRYDVDALAYFAAVEATGATLATSQRDAHNEFVVALKANGLWTKIYAFFPFMGQTLNAAKINAKSPGTYDILWNGTPFASPSGVQGSGTPQYGRIQFPTSNFVSLTSATMGTYVAKKDSGGGVEIDMGCSDGTNAWNLYTNSGTTSGTSNSKTQCGGAGITADIAWGSYAALPYALHSTVRRSGSLDLYTGGSFSATETVGLSSIPNVSTIGVLGQFFNATPTTPTLPSRKLAMFSYIAQELTSGEVAILAGLVETYVYAKNLHYIRLKSSSSITCNLDHVNPISYKSATGGRTNLASGFQSIGPITDTYLDVLPWMDSQAIFEYFGGSNLVSDFKAPSTNLTSFSCKYICQETLDLSGNSFEVLNLAESVSNRHEIKTLDLRNCENLYSILVPQGDGTFYFTSGEMTSPEPVSIFVTGTKIVEVSDAGYNNYIALFNSNAFAQDYSEMFVWGYNPYTYYRIYGGDQFPAFYPLESTATENSWTFMSIDYALSSNAYSFVGNVGAYDFPEYLPAAKQVIYDTFVTSLESAGLLSKAIIFNPVMDFGTNTPSIAISSFPSSVLISIAYTSPTGYTANGAGAIQFNNGIDTYGLSASNFCLVMSLRDNNGSAFTAQQGYMGAKADATTARCALYADNLTSTTYRPRVRVGNQDNTPVTSRSWNATDEKIIILNSNSTTTLDRATYNTSGTLTYRDSFISGTQTGTLGLSNLFFLSNNNGFGSPLNPMQYGKLGPHGIFSGLTTTEQAALASIITTYNNSIGR
jgi:hypothetical protein